MEFTVQQTRKLKLQQIAALTMIGEPNARVKDLSERFPCLVVPQDFREPFKGLRVAGIQPTQSLQMRSLRREILTSMGKIGQSLMAQCETRCPSIGPNGLFKHVSESPRVSCEPVMTSEGLNRVRGRMGRKRREPCLNGRRRCGTSGSPSLMEPVAQSLQGARLCRPVS
jgi:hypothetical protein